MLLAAISQLGLLMYRNSMALVPLSQFGQSLVSMASSQTNLFMLPLLYQVFKNINTIIYIFLSDRLNQSII